MTAIAGHMNDYHEQVGMAEAVRRYWNNFANFTGRSNRGEFWWAVLALVIISVVLSAVDGAIGQATTRPLSNLFGLVTLIPSLALTVRRLHDIGRTGWWVALPTALMVLATVVFLVTWSFSAIIVIWLAAMGTAIVLLVWACQQGEPRANRFG